MTDMVAKEQKTELAVIASNINSITEDLKELKDDNKKNGALLTRLDVRFAHLEEHNKEISQRVNTLENLTPPEIDHDCEKQPKIVELNTKTESLISWRRTLVVLAISSVIGLLGLCGGTIWGAATINSEVKRNTRDIEAIERGHNKKTKTFHDLGGKILRDPGE